MARADRHPFAPRAMRLYVWGVVLLMVSFKAEQTYRVNVLHGHLSDFGRLYYAALAWRGGGSLYAPTVATTSIVGETNAQMGNVAAPVFHLLVLPFTYLPPGPAFGLWVLCNLAGWAISLHLCLREWRVILAPADVATIAIAIVASTLTAGAFETGQYVGLLMLPATLAWRAARREQWIVSGAWLGVLAYQKPFVLVFIMWLAWHRRWRGTFASLLVVMISIGCGEMIFGDGVHQQWQAALRDDVPRWGWLYVNASIFAPWMRAFGPSPAFAHAIAPRFAVAAALACSLIIAIVTVYRVRRTDDLDREWTTMWLAALLISPLGWTYYLWFATGPLGGAILHAWRNRPALKWPLLALGGCFILPLSVVLIGQPSVIASFTAGSLYTWAILATWMAVVALPSSEWPCYTTSVRRNANYRASS